MDKLIPSHQLLLKVLRNKKRSTSLYLLNHQKSIFHETVIQINSEDGEGEIVSGTTSKISKQNTVAILNDICNVRHDVKGEVKYSKLVGKLSKQNTIINRTTIAKKDSVKESVKTLGIRSCFSYVLTFEDRVSSKMTAYQKYAVIKNVFKPDQYF